MNLKGGRQRPYRTVTAVLALLACAAAACDPAADPRAPAAQEPSTRSLLASAAQVDSAAAAAVRARFPGVGLRTAEAEVVPGTDWRATWFRFAMPGSESRYGSVIAVWTADAGRLVWTYEHRGDFSPHRLTWTDADRDGRTDLFFTAGEEEVFESYLFLNQGGRTHPADSAFALAYRSGNDYTTLLDLDGDGGPELVDSGHAGEEHVESLACQEDPLPQDLREAAGQEYQRLAGEFDAANFKYGMEEFAPYTLHLLDPVRILQARDGEVRDVTREFPQHLQWRIGALERYRAAAGADCAGHLRTLLRHLRAPAP